MPETTVKMLGSVEASSGSTTMGISLGSSMSQWGRISLRGVALCYTAPNTNYGFMGINVGGSSNNDIYNYYYNGSNQWGQENLYASGTNYMNGMTMQDYSTNNLGLGRVIEIDLHNPGVYGLSGTNNQRWMMTGWTQQAQGKYSNGSYFGATGNFFTWRVLSNPSSVTIYAPSGMTFKTGSRMDAYAWANGT
tara:strand:+ start:440 stop:1015 length:576 start_codon:yes stop_codon:yes gene_type:complete